MPNRRKGEGKGKRIGNGNPSKATASTSAMMSRCNLPEDFIFEILSRLPVKSLLRFQSVSVPWQALIKNPKFISLHLNRTAMNPKNDSVIIRQYHIMSLFNVNSIDKPINLDHPFPEIFPRMELVGCYNGLVCLSYPPLGQMIILWNPATKQYKVIQLSTTYLDSEDVDKVSVGFGFDPVANDYKIIRIMRLNPKPPRDLLRVEVEVYSAKTDSWKMFRVETPFFIPLTRCTAILKGAPYWKAVIRDEEEDSRVLIVLLYFDPQNEAFSLWQSPEFRDELVSLVYSSREESNKYVYVWMEDDCKESHIKKIGPIPIKVVNIILCCKNVEILAEGTEGKLFLYDPETDGIKNIPVDEVQANSYEAFSYTESLVSFEGMKQVGQKE